MPQAMTVLLGEMRRRGHHPQVIRDLGGYIRAQCQRCSSDGEVYADGAGEYLLGSARGMGFIAQCRDKRQRLQE
jgi:methyl coenzyme M reductase subunit C-like uncharacterized protein (methanogenesis marker protein 7)